MLTLACFFLFFFLFHLLGKTTLLNMLAGRLSAAGNGKSEGRILLNGQKRDHRRFIFVGIGGIARGRNGLLASCCLVPCCCLSLTFSFSSYPIPF